MKTIEHFKKTREVFIDDEPFIALGNYPYDDTPTFFEQLKFDSAEQTLAFLLEKNHLSSFFRSLSACDFLVGNGWVELPDLEGDSDDWDEPIVPISYKDVPVEGLEQLADTVGMRLARYMHINRHDVYRLVANWSRKNGYFNGVDATWEEMECHVEEVYDENVIHYGIIIDGYHEYSVEFPEMFEGNQDTLEQIYIPVEKFDDFIRQINVFLQDYVAFYH